MEVKVIKAKKDTKLRSLLKEHKIDFRTVFVIKNNKIVTNEDKVIIKKGEVIKIIPKIAGG